MPTLTTTSPSDADLLARFAETRDEKAFSTLMQQHWGFVYAIAKRSLTNTALAEDATQQTFITLAKKAKTLRTNRPLGPWLYRTAIQEASNLRRGEMRHQKRNRDYQAISHLDSDSGNQHSAKLHQALSSLSEKDRQLIILRYYQGFTADQIATQLKISPAAAQRRTHRALERLSTLANSQEQDQTSFRQALPALLAPSLSPSPATLSKILATSGKSTGLLAPAAGWVLATAISVAAVKQSVPPPPADPPPNPEAPASTRVTSERKPRSSAPAPKPPRNPDVATFINQARNSPAGALAWGLEKFPSPNQLESFLREATHYLAQADLNFAKEILTAARGEKLRTAIIKEIFAEQFFDDPVSAIQWIESLPHHSDHTAATRVTFSSTFRNEHLIDQLQEALAVATKEPVRLWAVETLCQIYEELDETKILQLANTLEGEAREEALNHMVQIQLDRDHPLANELIDQLKGQVRINERSVAQRAPDRYLDTLLPWLSDPPNPRSGIYFDAGRLLEAWLAHDPKAARQWFQQNNPGEALWLSPQTRKALTLSTR